mgnify:CR=1 FL=1
MEKSFCEKCGRELALGTTFCSKCNAQNTELSKIGQTDSTPTKYKKTDPLVKAGIIFVILIVIIGIIGAFTDSKQQRLATSFDECVIAVGEVMESYPRQCKTDGGRIFVEDIGNELEKIDLITIDQPRPNQAVTSPLTISGQARGYWFFEASFPIKLYDAHSNILATGIATAQSEWMTENFVNFTAELTFNQPNTPTGTLVLEKDNPSDLAENNDSLYIPIKF